MKDEGMKAMELGKIYDRHTWPTHPSTEGLLKLAKEHPDYQSDRNKSRQLTGERMAHIETWYICPGCKAAYDTRKEAERCAVNHIYSEQWAVSSKYPGKAVKVTRNRPLMQALAEAELPD